MGGKGYVIHSELEICGIRKAAAAAAWVRDRLVTMISVGMSTKEINDLAAALIVSAGGTSAFLGYKGYPGHICISVNDEVVHGIGRLDNIIDNGDVLSIDIGVNLKGFVGDTAITLIVGKTLDNNILRLLEGTKKALAHGIEAARPGNHVRDISIAVEKVAKSAKLSVVRDYVGHGCGTELHEPPEIPNFATKQEGVELRPGMVLAIEPMFNLGTYRVITDADGWTVRTIDGKISAHFEHMVLVTEKEPEILT